MSGNVPGFNRLNQAIQMHQWLESQKPEVLHHTGWPVRYAPLSQSLVPVHGERRIGPNVRTPLPKIPDPATAAQAAELAAVKGPLRKGLKRQGPLDLQILTRQFALEGQALRCVLGEEGADNLASGAVLEHAVAGNVTSTMRAVVSEDTIQYVIKQAGGPGMPPPLPEHALAASHPGLGQPGSIALEAHRATALDSAYKRALAALEAADPRDQAAIDNVKLSQMAFKVRTADRENQLELSEIGSQIGLEQASNRFPGGSKEGRAEWIDSAKAKLDQAQADLKAFHGASNVILHDEHLKDLKSRSINFKDPDAKSLPNLGRIFLGQGIPQAVSSAAHWGYARNEAMNLSAHFMHLSPTHPVSIAVQAAVLGATHKFVGDFGREGLHHLTELGGLARGIETVKPEVYYPDSPLVQFNDQGQLHVHTKDEHTALNTGNERKREEYRAKALNGGFGTIKGDLAGIASFSAASTGRALLGNVSAFANSIHGKASSSFAGGAAMSTLHGMIQLADRHGEFPTRVLAKHRNPRTAWHRMMTSAQKLDMTKQANRLDLYSRSWGAAVGMAMASAIQHNVSAPLEAAHKQGDSSVVNLIARAVAEGARSGTTLSAFYPALVAGTEGKKLNPTGTSELVNRLQAGWRNIASPLYLKNGAEATHATPPGTIEHKLQDGLNVVRGVVQIPSQAGVVLTEGLGQLAAKGTRLAIDAGKGLRKQPPAANGGEEGGQQGQV